MENVFSSQQVDLMMNSETRQDVLSIMLLQNILQHQEIMKKQTPEHGCMLYYHQQLTLLFTVLTLMYILLAYHLFKPQIKLYLYN